MIVRDTPMCRYGGQFFPCFAGYGANANRAEEGDAGVVPTMARPSPGVPGGFVQAVAFSVTVSVITSLVVNYLFDRRR